MSSSVRNAEAHLGAGMAEVGPPLQLCSSRSGGRSLELGDESLRQLLAHQHHCQSTASGKKPRGALSHIHCLVSLSITGSSSKSVTAFTPSLCCCL
eukprot:1117738-Amphidinium_carterae.1